jgi:glycosyltransferase involved in cell wall biosynthesis
MTVNVSICMITYNQSEFIGKAIESILDQRGQIEMELVISDDNSLDETEAIVHSYITEHPKGHCIRYFRNDANVGMVGNLLNALKLCKGKYIAFCEGDDYWIDTLKLKKQYTYLEENPLYSAVFTDMIRVDALGNWLARDSRVPAGITRIETYMLMQMNFIHTSNFFFKREILTDKVLDFVREMPYGDMSLFLCCSLAGPIGYIPDCTSAYRVNVGVLRGLDKAERAMNGITIRRKLVEEFDVVGLGQQYNVGKKGYYLKISEGLLRRGNFVPGLRAYLFFWLSSFHRIFPAYPVVARINLISHFAPMKAMLGYVYKRVLRSGSNNRIINVPIKD